MTNQQPKNLPQYYQGTPGEVKLAAFLKNHDYLTKQHFDQIINTFRASEYMVANVVDHYVTDVHPSPPEGIFHLTRRREGNQIVLGMQSIVSHDSLAPDAVPFEGIPALNVGNETLKRICTENGLYFVGVRELRNVLVYGFHSTGNHQHKTTLNVSVEKEYQEYVSQVKASASQMDRTRPSTGVAYLQCDKYSVSRWARTSGGDELYQRWDVQFANGSSAHRH